MQKTDLSKYNNSSYHPGGTALKRGIWYLVNAVFFKCLLFPFSGLKLGLLNAFGAKVGTGITIKPGVNIKYPWLLTIGNNTWIGEDVWIDNLVPVVLGPNVCLSQGALLLTGSHDYKKTKFDLITGSIILEEGVWIGARAVVNHGITAASHAVLTAGSIATKNMEAYSIYQGNPAIKIRDRAIS